MNVQTKEKILENIAATEAAMLHYDEKTSEIISTDIDETLEEITRERDNILSEIHGLREELERIASEECSPEESGYIARLLKNEHVPLGLSAELKEIRKAVVKLRSVFLSAQEKDKQAAKRVDARVQELRAELEDLNDDKRRLDFYNKQQSGGRKGGSFDSTL